VIIKLAGTASIAATTRHYARGATRPLATPGLIPAGHNGHYDAEALAAHQPELTGER
jgi:hypothetical protein